MKKSGKGMTLWPKKKAHAGAQAESVWLGRPREGFTADMAAHFVKADPENKMQGVTMQNAKRHGIL